MWEIIRTDEIKEWIQTLDDDAREALLQHFIILKNIGPSLGRPYVDTVSNSKHKNMKELRVQNKLRVYRIFFAFDPERKALLLLGGDKKGNKQFYKEMIVKADKLYDRHIRRLEAKDGK